MSPLEPDPPAAASLPIHRRLAELPREVKWLLLGIGLFSLGAGLTLPFLLVYLHQVRGISTQLAGAVIAWIALVGLLTGPLWGVVIDRIGPRVTLLLSLLVEASAVLCLAFVTNVWQAFLVASLLAIGSAGGWPAQTALLSRLVPSPARPWLFGLQFMLLNLGLGIGGLVAATFVDVTRPGTFQLLYVVDACSYLAYVAVLVALPKSVGLAPVSIDPEPQNFVEGRADSTKGGGGYRQLLADRRFLRLLGVAAVMVLFGYAQIEVGLTAYATQVAGVPARWLGIAFAANTATIVVGQLLVLSRLEGRSRSRALCLTGLAWGASWLVIAVSGEAESTWVLLLGLAVGASIFALGETIWSPVFPALVNDLAPEHLRGRYNAVSSLAWNFGSVLGPLYAGVLIGGGWGTAWVGVTVTGCLLGAVGAWRLHAHLDPVQDGRQQPIGVTMGE
ncbi:MAG TPA: MFS transporter [Actinomycetes bacterium]|nr:MFS transporter [Actinomycetes bacterium]